MKNALKYFMSEIKKNHPLRQDRNGEDIYTQCFGSKESNYVSSEIDAEHFAADNAATENPVQMIFKVG